jgi:predicted lipoprotein with Yx(FWY)xxD motif
MRHRAFLGEHRATTRIALVLAVAAVVAASGFLAAGALAGGTTAVGATVSLRSTKLGRILVNSRGHTLYLFVRDRNGRSSCTSSCATYWPPLLSRSKPTAGAGVKASLLGTTRRANGSLQVTYNRHPLYTYLLDKRAGQTSGEGVRAFGAKWWALNAKGTAVLAAPAMTTTTPYPSSTTTSPGYTTTVPYP